MTCRLAAIVAVAAVALADCAPAEDRMPLAWTHLGSQTADLPLAIHICRRWSSGSQSSANRTYVPAFRDCMIATGWELAGK